MTLQQLRYVIKTVECGSITEAAKQLYVAQPSLSAAIRELEAELSIEIFHRFSKGIALTQDGAEFLSYARQVMEQTELLEERYRHIKPSKKLCAISTQHYSFAVEAFVRLLKEADTPEYEMTLRETRTNDIIQDVVNLRSELGILYLCEFNEKVITKLLKENHLEFHLLFTAKPHVFISAENPLAEKKKVTLKDLEAYPCLSFEQGAYNSFYFSEEILSTISHKKSIHVSDRATLFNLLIGLNGYTISSGVLNEKLNGTQIVSVPLETEEQMHIGWISREDAALSKIAKKYIAYLEEALSKISES